MASIGGKTPASSSWSAGNPSFVGTRTRGSQRSSVCVGFSDLFGDAKIICVTLDTGARVTYCNDYLLLGAASIGEDITEQKRNQESPSVIFRVSQVQGNKNSAGLGAA